MVLKFDTEIVAGVGKSAISLNSRHLDECLAYYYKHKIDIVVISPFMGGYGGYKPTNIEFLKEHPNIKGLDLPYADCFDLSPILNLNHLKYLRLNESSQALDLSVFPLLERADLWWHRGLTNFKALKHLKVLGLFRFHPKTKDFTEFDSLESLEKLHLCQSNITSLRGIERFPDLNFLALRRLLKLCNIENIRSLTRLEEVEFEVCKKVNNFSAISDLVKLRHIIAADCGTVKSVAPFLSLPKVETIVLLGTRIRNEDKKTLEILRKKGVECVT